MPFLRDPTLSRAFNSSHLTKHESKTFQIYVCFLSQHSQSIYPGYPGSIIAPEAPWFMN